MAGSRSDSSSVSSVRAPRPRLRSPRRAELLRAAGFVVRGVGGSTIDESVRPGEGAGGLRAAARAWRRPKRAAVRPRLDAIMLGADTTVVVDGESRQAARRRGRRGACCGGFGPRARGPDRRALRHGDGRCRAWSCTVVHFARSAEEDSPGTSRQASGATRPARTRSRGWRRVSSRGSTVRTRTSSACPWRWWPGSCGSSSTGRRCHSPCVARFWHRDG